jgi:hypothetical protein
MLLRWTQHLKDPEERTAFESSILGSKRVLNRLMEILQEDETALDRSEIDIKTFEHPNWAYKQAYKNGQRNCIANLKKLIDLDQQKGT